MDYRRHADFSSPYLPAGCAVLGGSGAEPPPALLPGDQPSHAAKRSLEPASAGRGRHQGVGIGLHTTPPRGERTGKALERPRDGSPLIF